MDTTTQWPPKGRLTFLGSLALLIAVAVLLLRGSASAAPTGASGNGKTGSVSSPVPAASCWLAVSSPNPYGSSSQLLGVTTVSADDAWAVGYSGYVSNTFTLIEHWNSTAWTVVDSPGSGSKTDRLNAVDAVSATDIWAVGSTGSQPLIVHWNGAAWSVVPGPSFSESHTLNNVVAISPNDAWAVGVGSMGGYSGGFILHWDGTHWIDALDLRDNYLYGVDGISSNDVWAVGSGHGMHWDGTHWNQVDLPVPSSCYAYFELDSVSVHASNDVWSAGYCPSRDPGINYPLLFNWDGAAWTNYPVDLNLQGLALIGVDALSSDDVWAVGSDNSGYPSYIDQTVAFHWDGTRWTQASTPHHGTGNSSFAGVVADANGDIWAVGAYEETPASADSTLIERYYPTCPPPPPCPGGTFTDVCPGDFFYTATLALVNDGILSGYNTSPPCLNTLWIPCFNPSSSSTRGQISKVVSLAAGFNDPVSGQAFEDVPPGSTFYTYTERMAERAIITGYPCGGPGEPCVLPFKRPYFRTNNNVSRGQLSKMIALAFDWNDPVRGHWFQDVPPGSTFYSYIGQLLIRHIITGYPDGLFRPNYAATRGQLSKIVQLSRVEPTSTPTPISTIVATETPVNPDCLDIPPSQDMQISPGICEPAGTRFAFVGSGFQAGESVGVYLTDPNGNVFGAPFQIHANQNGDTDPVTLTTDSNFQPGHWSLTMRGITSHHMAIGNFAITLPGYPQK